jgi:hypothetical protein
MAVAESLAAIDSMVAVVCHEAYYRANLVPAGADVFACVDSMRVRRQIFRDFQEHDWPVFFDGRMAAESLRVFCIDHNDRHAIDLYRTSYSLRTKPIAKAAPPEPRSTAPPWPPPFSAPSTNAGPCANPPPPTSTSTSFPWTALGRLAVGCRVPDQRRRVFSTSGLTYVQRKT